MADRTRALHVATESTFSTDPSADGSAYLALQCEEVGYPEDGLVLEDRQDKTGRNEASDEEATQDGSSISATWFGRGFTSGSGDGVAAATADAIDLMLNNALGTALAFDGEGVGAGSTTANFITDAAQGSYVARLPVALWHNALGRTAFRAIASIAGAPTYTIDTSGPVWDTAPLTADHVWGSRVWFQTDELQAATGTLSVVAEISSELTLMTGMRHRSLSLECETGRAVRFKSTLSGDDLSENVSKANLPQVATWPTSALGQRAGAWWGSTLVHTSKTSVAFNLASTDLPSSYGANGRSDNLVAGIDPVVTLDVIHAAGDAWKTDRRAGTIRPLLVQFGGAGSASRGNAFCFYAPRAQLKEVGWSQIGGFTRRQLTYKVVGSGLAGAYRWALARI